MPMGGTRTSLHRKASPARKATVPRRPPQRMATLKSTAWEKGGVRVSGAKSVGSISAQANDIFFTNLSYPNHPPEACVWGCLPAGTEGIKMISREILSSPGADPFDHPLNHKGEEADQLVVFDNVFSAR